MTRALSHLSACLKRLRVWEQELIDLAYSENDPRGIRHASDMPPEWHREHASLSRAVVLAVAIVAGESRADCEIFSDAYASPSNPYNLNRVRSLDPQLANAIARWRF